MISGGNKTTQSKDIETVKKTGNGIGRVKMALTKELINFDMAEQLRRDEDIAGYLSMVLEDGDTDELIHALGYIAKGRHGSNCKRQWAGSRKPL